MHKYAGVTLDWLDDRGELLRRMFPSPSELPEVIKHAAFRPADEIPDSAYALCLRDSGDALHKFACLDAGTTIASTLYFAETHEALEPEAQKVAATNLATKCLEYRVPVPRLLRDLIGTEKVAGNAVTVRGATTRVITKDHEKLAYALPSEQRYPITGWRDVDRSTQYWREHGGVMPMEHRREFAVNVTKIAAFLGHPVPDDMLKFAAQEWAEPETVELAMEARKLAADRLGVPLDDYASVYRQRASLGAEKYAEALLILDRGHGMSKLWDREIPNPYRSTFGLTKKAETIWTEGADRMTSEQLANLVTEHSGELDSLFASDLIEGLEQDPRGVFNSLPLPQKRVIARLAAAKTHDGRTGVEGPNSDVDYPGVAKKDKEAALRKFASMAGKRPASELEEISGVIRRHRNRAGA